MRIVLDRHIPYLIEALSPVADVVALEPEAISADTIQDAEALIVRTRTRVNRALLEGTNVQFVATATIGYDHIDTAYCEEKGIEWISCPGCNAQAVCDYVEAALTELYTPEHLHRMHIGIVGVGHVGSLVAKMAERLGMTVSLSDAPKGIGESLDEIAQNCDIITFHTPLTQGGKYATYHLCNTTFLQHCRPNALIINAARGGIVDEQALLSSGHPCVIDCWEKEPQLNQTLLRNPQTRLASFHIAGYSLQGKYNASHVCVEALAKHFGLPPIAMPTIGQATGDSQSGWLGRVTESLRQHPDEFEQLRTYYQLR